MAAITFTQIMNCYPDNPLVYKHIKQDCGKLIPFVGAGLSVSCYPLWPKALKMLKDMVADPEAKRTIAAMLKGKEPQLLEAAQALEDHWGQRGMADHLLELFSATKIQEHKEELSYQSVWLLPLLFPGKPAVTTNFDRVLETVYHMQGCQFDTKILPNRQELQDQLRQGERHGLLKLHGDIGSETLEYSSIIFGKRQYEAAYQPGTPMVTNLQAWFSGKMLLFLGCSLKEDEYLNLLQEVVQLHPGVTHYAILERTNKKNAAARARQMRDQWGIQALFYPKGRHEAVRVILEKLLEDRNPTAYQALPTHVGALTNQSPSSRFHYKSGAVSFHGRREELVQLREFCGQEDVAFRWWAVTGAGGAGKSRLVYEFGREMERASWNVLWLNSAHMDQLEVLPISTKTLVVVDYAQAYLRPLGRWIEKLAQRDHLVPVRLLLLERDGASLDESSWGSGLKVEVGRLTLVRRSCWREPFLQLNSLQEEELLRIMTDFAATVGKNLPEVKGQQLLDTLKTTDPGLWRPLYAMFLTDAWANGEEPERWGQKAVLDYVLQRENEYFEEKLGPKLYDLSDVMCQLRLVTTIWDGITPEQVAQEYPHLWSEVQVQANAFNCAKLEKKLLRQVGLLQGTELAGLKPDLLGEYFVLQHLNEPEVLQLLFPDGWQAKVEVVTFLFRMYLDYHDDLENVEAFWDYMLCPPTKAMRIYGMILVNVAGLSNTHNVLAVDRLKRLWEVGGKLPVDALLYAQGLYNLTNKQRVEEKKATVDRLQELYERYSRSEEIALLYANGLANLYDEQGIDEEIATIERLKELQERYSGNEKIAIEYANGLVNLSNRQEIEGAEAAIERLRELQERYSGNEKIAVEYANGLMNLSKRQGVGRAEAAIERLKELQERYSGNEEILFVYANGLMKLTDRQGIKEAEYTVERLKGLQEEYPEDEGMAIAYAIGLYSLAIRQSNQEAKFAILKIKSFCHKYSENEEVKVMLKEILEALEDLLDK